MPVVLEHFAVRGQCSMGEHCPFRTPCCARCVEDRSEVQRVTGHCFKACNFVDSGVDERPFFRSIQGPYCRYTGVVCNRVQGVERFGFTDKHRRFCVAQKIADFGRGVSCVERQKHAPCQHCADVEFQHRNGFRRLYGDAVAGLNTCLHQRGCHPLGIGKESGVACFLTC